MKNITENSKITLTIGQLKRLVKEATNYTYIDTAVSPIVTKDKLANVFVPGTIFKIDDGEQVCTFEFVKWDIEVNRGMWFKPLNKATEEYSLKIDAESYNPDTGLFWFDHDGLLDMSFEAKTPNGKIVKNDGWVEESKINEAEENIVPVKFNKAELLKLGFRKMYSPDDMLWAAALPDSLVFSNQYISVVCGNNNGNREIAVSLNNDNNGPEWVMINPTEENLVELFDTMLPERLLKDTTNFKIRY